jgi:hypothetical protein
MKMCEYAMAAVVVMILCASITIGQQRRESVTASEVNGTFELAHRGKFKDMSNGIRVLALGGGKLRIAIEALYPYLLKNGEPMAHTGELDGTAEIKGDTAIYKSADLPDCLITLQFKRSGILDVAQEGTCGFGQNVNASGVYRKVSTKKPSFGG